MAKQSGPEILGQNIDRQDQPYVGAIKQSLISKHPTFSLNLWMIKDRDQGSQFLSINSSVPLDDGNGKQNAFLYGIMEYKRKISIGLLDLKLLWI